MMVAFSGKVSRLCPVTVDDIVDTKAFVLTSDSLASYDWMMPFCFNRGMLDPSIWTTIVLFSVELLDVELKESDGVWLTAVINFIKQMDKVTKVSIPKSRKGFLTVFGIKHKQEEKGEKRVVLLFFFLKHNQQIDRCSIILFGVRTTEEVQGKTLPFAPTVHVTTCTRMLQTILFNIEHSSETSQPP